VVAADVRANRVVPGAIGLSVSGASNENTNDFLAVIEQPLKYTGGRVRTCIRIDGILVITGGGGRRGRRQRVVPLQ
jgi:hypothetical protein